MVGDPGTVDACTIRRLDEGRLQASLGHLEKLLFLSRWQFEILILSL